MTSGHQDVPRDGPANPTPLALAFYEALQHSDLRDPAGVAKATGLDYRTVWAYLNGTRGGRRGDSANKIRTIAQALGMDAAVALELADTRVHSDVRDVEQKIRSLNWPREAQDDLIAVLRDMDRSRRRR